MSAREVTSTCAASWWCSRSGAGAAERRRWSCPYAVPASCRPKTSRIAIMGVGKINPLVVSGLVEHFHDCYGLPVEVAPPIEAPATAGTRTRGQWTAEALLAAMPGCRDGDPLCDASVLVIGVTSEDIYTTRENWRYAFTSRDLERHAAIISTAQMTSLAPGTVGRARAQVRGEDHRPRVLRSPAVQRSAQRSLQRHHGTGRPRRDRRVRVVSRFSRPYGRRKPATCPGRPPWIRLR